MHPPPLIKSMWQYGTVCSCCKKPLHPKSIKFYKSFLILRLMFFLVKVGQ